MSKFSASNFVQYSNRGSTAARGSSCWLSQEGLHCQRVQELLLYSQLLLLSLKGNRLRTAELRCIMRVTGLPRQGPIDKFSFTNCNIFLQYLWLFGPLDVATNIISADASHANGWTFFVIVYLLLMVLLNEVRGGSLTWKQVSKLF